MASGIQRRKEERREKENGEVRGIPQRKMKVLGGMLEVLRGLKEQ